MGERDGALEEAEDSTIVVASHALEHTSSVNAGRTSGKR